MPRGRKKTVVGKLGKKDEDGTRKLELLIKITPKKKEALSQAAFVRDISVDKLVSQIVEVWLIEFTED